MTNNKETLYHDQFETLLLNKDLCEVYYEELDYQDGKAYWKLTPYIHSVDMNVIFKFDDGSIIQLKWDNGFYCYGLGIESLSTIEVRENIRLCTLSNNERWNHLIGQKITKINFYWDSCSSSSTGFIPVWLTLCFENAVVNLGAIEILEGKSISHWADHITVFFKDNFDEYFNLNMSEKITSVGIE